MENRNDPAFAGPIDTPELLKGLENIKDDLKRLEKARCSERVRQRKAETLLFTKFSKDNGILTKKIAKDKSLRGYSKDGSLCRMSSGKAEIVKATTMADLAEIVSTLQPNQALALGVFADEPKTVNIAAKKRLKAGERARKKGGDYGMVFAENRPALLLLDVDVDRDVPGFDGTTEGVWRTLENALPFLAGKAYYGRSSTSSEIYDGRRRLDDPRRAGQHFYIPVANGPDVPQILKALEDLLWLKGFGFIKISKSGQRLMRTFIDGAVGSPERLIFEAQPVLEDGLTQGSRASITREGDMLKLSDVPELAVLEQADLNAMKRRAYDEAGREAEATRKRWMEERVSKLAEKLIAGAGLGEGEARIVAERELRATVSGQLTGNFEISVDDEADGENVVTVDQILSQTDDFLGRYCRDPLEPELGPQKARIQLDRTGKLVIYSWARGGRHYELVYGAKGARTLIERAASKDDLRKAAQAIARVATDAVLDAELREALNAKGMKRAEINSIFKDAKAETSASQRQTEHPRLPVRPVQKDATHAELAADVRAALTVAGVEPVFDQGGIYTCSSGIWCLAESAKLKAWIGESYAHCDRAVRKSDYDGILGAFENLIHRPGFFDATRPGVAADGKFWSLDVKGKLSAVPLLPEHGARFTLPFAPDVDAKEPGMLGELFDMVFAVEHREGNSQAVGAVMGAAILGLGRQFKEAGFLIGAGDSGKSTIGALLKMFLPASAVSAVNLSRLSEDYALAELAGKRLNLPGEEPMDAIIPSAQLKQVTGGDPVTARQPYGRPFNFVPVAIQLFTANRMPPLKEHERQIYRRIVFVHFSRGVPKEKQIGKTEAAARKMFEAEGPALLGWMLKCAGVAIRAGTMQTEATLEASVNWRKVDDTVLSAFFGPEACFEITGDIGHSLLGKEAYDLYKDFALAAGRRPLGRNLFYDRIENSTDLIEAGISSFIDRKGSRRLLGVVDTRATQRQELKQKLEAVLVRPTTKP